MIEAKGDLPTARVGATLSSVGATLYLIGGLNQSEGWLESIYSFDTGIYYFTSFTDYCIWVNIFRFHVFKH